MKGQRILAFAIALLVAITGGLLVHERGIGHLVGAEGLELWTLDLRQRSAAESRKAGVEGARESEIVLVLFDASSVAEWDYLSPFPRPFIAGLIDALSAAGARTIGLDVYLEELFPTLGGDDLLRESIRRAGNVVLVAPMDTEVSPPTLAYPHPEFAGVAADVGASEIPTPFETARDATLVVRSAQGLEPSWALSLFAHARGLDVDSLLARAWENRTVELGGFPERWGELPPEWFQDGESAGFAHSFPIRFIGPPSRPGAEDASEGTFTTFSASMVPLLAPFTPEFFRDKIVMVGTGFHDSDKFRTPFYEAPVHSRADDGGRSEIAGWTYGVEVHANALQNLLDSEFLRPLGFGWVLLLMAALAGAVCLLTFWLGAGWGAVAAVTSATLALALAGWAFLGEIFFPWIGTVLELEGRFLWVPVVAPLTSVLLAYLGSTAYVSIVEGREKRFIRGAFGKYVSPEVVAQIAESPAALRLGGQKRPLTILFSDLAGFTTLSERLDAEELVTLLNEYLTEMTDIVMEEEGTLDKYIGDAIMAFWNAPKEQPDHADRALRCAIKMQRKMAELNRRWAKDQGEELVVRIGVNTGAAVVGNVGGQNRFDYSAIGDPVNLAARLEPANKSYDTLVMASEFTLKGAAPAEYYLRELDLLAVKGKLEPVRVYEILEMQGGDLTREQQESLSHYNTGLAAYQRRDWELAARYFQAALDSNPQDGPAGVYLERARDCIANPPPADWDFVVRRQVK